MCERDAPFDILMTGLVQCLQAVSTRVREGAERDLERPPLVGVFKSTVKEGVVLQLGSLA